MNPIESLLFPVLQKALRNDFHKKYRFLLDADDWCSQRRRDYAFQQLRNIVSHAYENVPFYGELYKAHGVSPEALQCPEDIARFPIVTKSRFKNSTHSYLSRTASKTIPYHTSGSTGIPFDFHMDRILLGWKAARYFYLMKQAGLFCGTSYIKIWGTNGKFGLQDFFTRFILQRMDVNCFGLDDTAIETILQTIQKKQPFLIEAYASAVAALAERECCPSVPRIITSAETLYPHQREKIKSSFNAVVLNRYGSREFGNIAQERAGDSILQVLDLNFLVESVDGRLLVSCFDNYTMPFIRYDTGDIGRMSRAGERPAIEGLEGRTSHIFRTPRGQLIPPSFFSYAVSGRFGEHIKQFQVNYSTAKIVVRLIPLPSFDDQTKTMLHDFLKNRLDETIVEIVAVDRIDMTTSTGKSRLIVVNEE